MLKAALVSKELLAVLVFILLFLGKLLRKKVPTRIDIAGFVYGTICIGYLAVFPTLSSMAVLTSFRSALLPVLLFTVGYWAELNESEVRTLIRIIIGVSIVAVLVGFIEIIMPVQVFWNGLLDIHGYLRNVKGLQEGLSGGFVRMLPGNFWGAVGARRLAGLLASPLAMGYYLAIPIVFLVSRSCKNLFRVDTLLGVLLATGLLMTETRAAIIATIVAVMIFFLKTEATIRLKANKRLLIIAIMAVLGAGVILSFTKYGSFITASMNMREGRTIGHIEALKKGMSSVPETLIAGKGFGTAGGWAANQTGGSGEGVGESAYFTLLYQIGGGGLLAFIVWWCMIIYELSYHKGSFFGDADIGKVLFSVSIGYVLTGFISEQMLTFTSVGHYWLLAGTVLGSRKE